MAKPHEKAYCNKCDQQRTFVHKSVLVGYECAKCGTPYKHSNKDRNTETKDTPKSVDDRTHTIIFND